MKCSTLKSSLQSARHSPEFENYLQVRDSVCRMLDEGDNGSNAPSGYWDEELAGFDYLLAQYYDLREVSVLDIPYNLLDSPKPPDAVPGRGRRLLSRLVQWPGVRRPEGTRPARSIYDYRHLVGAPRG